MKLTCILAALFLTFSFFSVRVQAEEIVVSIPLSELSFIKNEKGVTQFSGEDLQYLSQSGEPAIPFQVVHVLLPPDTDASTVLVSMGEHVLEPVPGIWQVEPVKPPVTWEGGREFTSWPEGSVIVDGKDRNIYEQDVDFPSHLIGDVQVSHIGKWTIAQIPVALFQYNPMHRQLFRLRDADLMVTFDRRITLESMRRSLSGAGSPEMRERVSGLVVNFQEAAAEYLSLRSAVVPGVSPKPGYIIITTNEIVSQSVALDHFIDNKKRRGFNAVVITESEWGGGMGDAAAENIRTWLQNNYSTLDIQYVLLIGNPHPESGDVPMKMLWPRSRTNYYPYYREAPSDFYYADLTGNWDLDGDGMYGEWGDDFGAGGVDRLWEVMVGRIPCYGDVAGLDAILAKIISYENTTSTGAAWRKNVLLPMKPLDSYTPSYHLGEAIKDDILFRKRGWDYQRVYDNDYELMPAPETMPCTTDNVTDAWNASPFGAIFWLTHGWSGGASSVMDLYHAETLNDQYPAFTFQGSCLNAYPETESNLSYALLKNGGIVTVGATRVSWYYRGQTRFTNSATISGFAYEYARRLIGDEKNCGAALFDMKQTLSPSGSELWMNFLVFNIYGDPSIAIAPSKEMIIDNGDLGTSSTGNWTACNHATAYYGDALCSDEPNAAYTYEADVEGRFEVYLWWPDNPDHCADSWVDIYDGETLLDQVYLKQDHDGARWNSLDIYHFDDSAKIVVNTPGRCKTSADAVWFTPRTVLFVDGDKPASGNGTSWAEAFQTIHEAMDADVFANEIWVKKGTYLLSSPIEIYYDVHLYGGFAGDETKRGSRAWGENKTVIDGQGITRCFNVRADAVIDGFTITNGQSEGEGGGMRIASSSSPVIANCIFRKNQTGAIWNGYSSYSKIENCLFFYNDAEHWGGAIFNCSSIEIDHCTFQFNASTGYGVVYNWSDGSNAVITNCLFSHNFSTAIVNYSNAPVISNCTIANNRIGALGNSKAFPTIVNSILWGNVQEIIDSGNSEYTIIHSDIQGGYAGENNIDANPLFMDADAGDFRLRAGSPCIDTGNNSVYPLPGEDLERGPRLIDGDGDGIAVVDMGADEAFITVTGKSLGIGLDRFSRNRIRQCISTAQEEIKEDRRRPGHLIYGLVEMNVAVENFGETAVARFHLPAPASEDYRWFLHSESIGWTDISLGGDSVETGDGARFSLDRSEVVLFVTDNGPYDEDPAPHIVRTITGLGTPAQPMIQVEPQSHDFGKVMIGSVSPTTFIVLNSGYGDLLLGEAVIAGNDPADFIIETDAVSGRTLPFSETGAIIVKFAPSSKGEKQAVLSVSSDDPNNPKMQVNLSGTGYSPKTMTRIAISGPEQIDENTGAQYTCIATFSDGGTSDITKSAEWRVDSEACGIDGSGSLTASAVDADQICNVSATYNSLSSDVDVTIKDIDEPKGIDEDRDEDGGNGGGCFIRLLSVGG